MDVQLKPQKNADTDPTANAGASKQKTKTNKKTEQSHRGGSGSTSAMLILAVSLILFFLPWVAAAIFGFTRPTEGFTFVPIAEALNHPRALPALKDTLLLTIATTIAMLVFLVPTIVFVNLYSPTVAKVVEYISILPLVVPAVALVSGASEFFRVVAPAFLVSMWSLVPLYVIITMPLCYRAIDAGVKALDLKTLFAASSSMGARGWQTFFQVILPNLRVPMLSASLLAIAMCFGEFAIASLLLHYTFPVFIVEISSSNPRGVAALSFLTILVTWLILAAISAISRADSQAKKH